MAATVHIITDERDRLYGPSVRSFVTVDEALTFAQVSVACGCRGQVVAVFDEEGDEVNGELWGAPEGTESTPEPAAKAPARSASKATWVEYAESQGVEVTSDMTRDDIIAIMEG